MKLALTNLAITTAASLTVACSGGGGSPSVSAFNCDPIVGSVSTPCTTCANVQNPSAMGDGDLGSSATYETYRSNNFPNNGQITFIVDRSSGANTPSGTSPGFAIQLPHATGISYTMTPAIRLNGAVVQTGDPVSVSGNTSGEFRYIGLEALAQFDGVQMNLQYSQPVGATEDNHQMSVLEACGDGALR